ncbi:hypothetical protein Tco_0081637, partial [Tanacetum coccineum]
NTYGDHVVLCAGIIGIRHRHDIVRNTLVDICFRSRISVGKEVDIRLCGGQDKSLRPADMLLYTRDKGIDVYVDLTGSSPLTQTGIVDFVSGCAKDAVTLLKRIRRISMTHDIEACATDHIYNKIGFAIAKGVRVFVADIYGDHALVKKLTLGLDMLLYSWDGGLDVCVDLTGSSPLTQTEMIDFVSGRAVIEAAQRKRVKYEAKCADIGFVTLGHALLFTFLIGSVLLLLEE